MAENKANKKREPRGPTKPVGERDRILVPIWADEYEAFDIEGEMTLSEARALVREAAGVAVPIRHTAGGSMSGLARAISEAPEDKRREIMRLLRESNADDEDESTDEEGDSEEQGE